MDKNRKLQAIEDSYRSSDSKFIPYSRLKKKKFKILISDEGSICDKRETSLTASTRGINSMVDLYDGDKLFFRALFLNGPDFSGYAKDEKIRYGAIDSSMRKYDNYYYAKICNDTRSIDLSMIKWIDREYASVSKSGMIRESEEISAQDVLNNIYTFLEEAYENAQR